MKHIAYSFVIRCTATDLYHDPEHRTESVMVPLFKFSKRVKDYFVRVSTVGVFCSYNAWLYVSVHAERCICLQLSKRDPAASSGSDGDESDEDEQDL